MIRTAMAILMMVVVAMPAMAADKVMVNPEVPLKAGYVGQPGEYENCPWRRELPKQLVEHSKGMIEITDADLATLPGRTLRISIGHMHTANGGMFSGPKWGAIQADLYEDGKLIGRYQHSRGSLDMFKSACSVLNKVAEALAVDTIKWLRRGQFEIPPPEDDSLPEIGPPEIVPPIQ